MSGASNNPGGKARPGELPKWLNDERIIDRFRRRVEWTDDPDECDEIRTGGKYPQMRIYGNLWKCHRVSWILHTGEPIPAGHDIHHECGNTICANTNHLKPLPRGAHSTVTGRERNENGGETLSIKDVEGIKMMITHTNISLPRIAEIHDTVLEHVSEIAREETWEHIDIPHGEFDFDPYELTDDDIRGVKYCLENTEWIFDEIREVTGVGHGSISRIKKGERGADIEI